jgi:hypothetical protein
MAARVKNFRFIHRVSVFARSARHINAYMLPQASIRGTTAEKF